MNIILYFNTRHEFYDTIESFNNILGRNESCWNILEKKPLTKIVYSEQKPVPLEFYINDELVNPTVKEKLRDNDIGLP